MSTSNRKSSRRQSLLAVFLIAALAITGVFAFLTATTETKVNTFTVGNIKIDLTEGPWDTYPDEDDDGIPDEAEDLVSGEVIEKAPSVKNDGANEAYTFLVVSVPKAQAAKIADNDGNVTEETNVELFSYTVNAPAGGTAGWVEIEDAAIVEDSDSFNHYVYAYSEKLAPGAETAVPLFETVTFANVTEEFAGDTAKQLVVNVEAVAIQADDEITSTEIAWDTLAADSKIQNDVYPPKAAPYA